MQMKSIEKLKSLHNTSSTATEKSMTADKNLNAQLFVRNSISRAVILLQVSMEWPSSRLLQEVRANVS